MGLTLHASARERVRLGVDTQGRLLELQVLLFDSADELIIHAMQDRKQYLSLLD